MYAPDAVGGYAAGAMPQLGAHCSLRPLIALMMYVPDGRLETAAGHRNAPLPDANDVYRAASDVGDLCSDVGDFYRAASYPELTAAVTEAAGGDGGGGGALPVTALSVTSLTPVAVDAASPPLTAADGTAALMKVPGEEGGGGGGVSRKTPVQSAFGRSMELSQDAARTNAYSAQALQRLLLQVKRASDEFKFRGQEREQLTAMADIGADLLEQYKFAAEANSAVAAAAAAAAEEAGDTIEVLEQRLIAERAARNMLESEFAAAGAATSTARTDAAGERLMLLPGGGGGKSSSSPSEAMVVMQESEALTALREGGISVFVGAAAAAGPDCRRIVYPYTLAEEQF